MNVFNRVFIVVSMLAATVQVQAYIYEFTNHTDQEVAVGMRYYGINEPVYRRLIEPGEMKQFAPGYDDIPYRKLGFLPEVFLYLVMPTAKHKANLDTAPWREFAVSWVPSESYTAIMDLVEGVGKTAEKIGIVAAKAGAAYMTGGATAAVEGGAGMAQNAAKLVAGGKKEEEAAPTTEATTTTTPVATNTSTSSKSGYGLSTLLKNAGILGSRSFMRNRHIDIIKDENGKIIFISLL